jgi:hypothetical protein
MTTKIPLKEGNLDTSLMFRAIRWFDLNTVDQFIDDVCEANGDANIAVPLDALTQELKKEGLSSLKYHCDLGADGTTPMKFKGLGIGTSLLRALETRGRGRGQPAVPDQRVFIHVQTKNKHPHSTKKHK